MKDKSSQEIQADQTVTLESYGLEAARESRSDLAEGMTLTEQKAAQNDGTMVTVVCITYKHEEFIAQALDSFLMQKTNFKFKVFVGEDHGPDGTADIVRDYAQRYPDIIVPFLREENMGAQHNLIDLCQHATSPYIAFCEGDDYWTDEYKLQKQVDYMEAHPEVRVCGMEAEIDAPEDWHLRSWYRETSSGKLIIPNSTPGFEVREKYDIPYLVGHTMPHTSTHFYRWNYDIDIPEWYYEGIIGDFPIFMMQTGMEDIGFIPEVVSIYRINSGSIYFAEDRRIHFLRTRLDMIRYLYGLLEYGTQLYEDYPTVIYENRIKLEAANYLSILVQEEDTDGIAEFFSQYPQAGQIALNAYLSFYRDSRLLTGCYGWEGYQTLVRNKHYRNAIRPLVWLFRKIHRAKVFVRGKLKNVVAFALYWKNTFVKKDPSLWVFSGFNKKGYMDNCKYLYEYVLEHHPEIKAVWLTLDQEVFDQLSEEQKPVMMMRTHACRKLVSRAAIGVTDHYRMSDYDAFSGLNDHLKIVQLWHGVGLKDMDRVIESTTVVGAKYPYSKSKWSHFRHGYYQEGYERYFMLVCPGRERVEKFAKVLHVPMDACFISGHPRNILLHQTQGLPYENNVIYAPTYRWDSRSEKELVRQLKEAADLIQETMEKVDGEFVIRLHPHTWRNYGRVLERMEKDHSRIRVDRDKDIYCSLTRYAVMITDYSSIAYDFVLLDRPIVFHIFDYEKYQEEDTTFGVEYEQYSPGEKTKTWADALKAVEAYIKDPQKDGAWRRRIRDEFYDMSVNDENNSQRIVDEIKRRLGLGKPEK